MKVLKFLYNMFSAFYTLRAFIDDLRNTKTIVCLSLLLGQFKEITIKKDAATEIICYI